MSSLLLPVTNIKSARLASVGKIFVDARPKEDAQDDGTQGNENVVTDTHIAPAKIRDLKFIEHLSNRFNHAVGFIPRIALVNRIEGRAGGGVLLARVNKQEGGFLHYGSMIHNECRIFQAAIDYDLQRQHHGLTLVNDFIERADDAGVRLITLRCRTDLNANRFWQAAGFRHVQTERGMRGNLFVWAKRLHLEADLLAGQPVPALPLRLHACANCGKPATGTIGPKGQLYRTCRTCTKARLTS